MGDLRGASGSADITISLKNIDCRTLKKVRDKEVYVSSQIFRAVRADRHYHRWDTATCTGEDCYDACLEDGGERPRFKGELLDERDLGPVTIEILEGERCEIEPPRP